MLSSSCLYHACRGSPLSQKVSFRALRQGLGRSLADVLRTDFRLSHRMVSGPSDFAEGVRALLIDKGATPTWRHPSLDKVHIVPLQALPSSHDKIGNMLHSLKQVVPSALTWLWKYLSSKLHI